MTTQQSGWSVTQPVRRALSRMVLEMRRTLEDDFTKQLASLGIGRGGIQAVGRSLSPHDQRSRDMAVATILRATEGGASHTEALESYVREAAFTFFNRVVGLRCLEERGLLIVQGQTETAVKTVPAFNAPSLYWRVRHELSGSADPREVWRETLHRACAAVSQQVRVLFDPDSEYAALLPLAPALHKIYDGFNSADLPSEVYAQDETLGWVYQYYNQEEKHRVYERLGRGKKIERPEELAAATCLYTERYMVDYLLQNTLGALWAEMHPDSRLLDDWPYYVDPPDGNARIPRPVRRLREITIMDPACGSGHFLVRAFGLLAKMYDEEGLERRDEVAHLILEQNLHGIDIDPRAVQIAALALYLKGCGMAGPDFKPRRLNLVAADVVLSGDAPPGEYMKRFQGDPEMEALVTGIWQGLRNVREFGSLLHPERAVDGVIRRRAEEDRERFPMLQRGEAEWSLWKAELMRGLREEFERHVQSEDIGQRLFGEAAAKGVSLVEALGEEYDVVVTNPPYAGSKNLNPRVKALVEKEYREGKRDLYSAFILRCRDFCRADGYVGMVTQQSWMFLRSFARLRKTVLEQTEVVTIAHLGPCAFEEIGGEVVSVALFTLRMTLSASEHRITGFRLVGPRSPVDKEALLGQTIDGQAPGVVSLTRQVDLLAIPETPFVYWLRRRLLDLLVSQRRLKDIAEVRQGLATAANERFTRCFWEAASFGVVRDGRPASGRWFRYVKGGRYQKWAGLEWLVVDWEDEGQAIKEHIVRQYPYLKGNWEWVAKNTDYYFRSGLTYSLMSGGSMAVRALRCSIFDVASIAVFPKSVDLAPAIGALLSTRTVSFLLRSTTQDLKVHAGYTANLPLPDGPLDVLNYIGQHCIGLKGLTMMGDPTEWCFASTAGERRAANTLKEACTTTECREQAQVALLHSLEGINESMVCDAYVLDEGDVQAVINETGTPAGWHPFILGYDALPESPQDLIVPEELLVHLRECLRRTPSSAELSRLKNRLRVLYQAGPGASVEDEATQDLEEEQEDNGTAFGALIPVPTETFIEELSQKLEIHPTSIYWLLREMRDQEGLVCPPELRRHLEDYVSVTILRLLGYRWPEQDAYEREHGPIMDPSLVDDDGIIPLVPCADQPTAVERARRRLEREFGDQGASQSESDFRQWVGRTIEDWLRRDFFGRHVRQFKQRPIAWHLVSPERTFEAFVLYHKLSRATLQKLRAQYAGGLMARLQGEQARAKTRGDKANVTRLQIQIEDVEEFRSRIEAIERGDELRYRIRCRWKGEEETGRPGPYAPDIDDGVKVNIRPFQEAGVLAVKEVIKKW